MADNFLERHYESYLTRKAAWEKAKRLGLKRVPPKSAPKARKAAEAEEAARAEERQDTAASRSADE